MPLRPATLVAWAAVGMLVGWVIHPLAVRWRGTAPTVTWLPALAFGFVGAFLLVVAWTTWRSMRGLHERPAAHQMVNRFVAGRASALVGALFAGGYAGFALSWVGSEAELGPQRMLRAGVAALAAAVMASAALLLERACRTGSEDRDP